MKTDGLSSEGIATLRESMHKQALDAISEAGRLVDAMRSLHWFSNRIQPQMSHEEITQRKMLLQLSAKLVESELDESLERVVAGWMNYKELSE